MKFNTTLCAAFCGTGKTFFVEKTNSSAIEIEYWKYKERGLQKEFVDEVFDKIGKFQYIFLSTEPESLKLLHEEGHKIILLYPENSLRNEYLDRYINRDSPYEFIGSFMKYWDLWLNELKQQDYCTHIVLKSGEYLCDALKQKSDICVISI